MTPPRSPPPGGASLSPCSSSSDSDGLPASPADLRIAIHANAAAWPLSIKGCAGSPALAEPSCSSTVSPESSSSDVSACWAYGSCASGGGAHAEPHGAQHEAPEEERQRQRGGCHWAAPDEGAWGPCCLDASPRDHLDGPSGGPAAAKHETAATVVLQHLWQQQKLQSILCGQPRGPAGARSAAGACERSAGGAAPGLDAGGAPVPQRRPSHTVQKEDQEEEEEEEEEEEDGAVAPLSALLVTPHQQQARGVQVRWARRRARAPPAYPPPRQQPCRRALVATARVKLSGVRADELRHSAAVEALHAELTSR